MNAGLNYRAIKCKPPLVVLFIETIVFIKQHCTATLYKTRKRHERSMGKQRFTYIKRKAQSVLSVPIPVVCSVSNSRSKYCSRCICIIKNNHHWKYVNSVQAHLAFTNSESHKSSSSEDQFFFWLLFSSLSSGSVSRAESPPLQPAQTPFF